MTKVQLTLNLPDSLAREAQAAGLLTEQAVERLIEEALRREAGNKLLDAMQRLRAANVPPLMEEEIAAEIKAVRAARKAAGEAGR
jgi:cytochrome P450